MNRKQRIIVAVSCLIVLAFLLQILWPLLD